MLRPVTRWLNILVCLGIELLLFSPVYWYFRLGTGHQRNKDKLLKLFLLVFISFLVLFIGDVVRGALVQSYRKLSQSHLTFFGSKMVFMDGLMIELFVLMCLFGVQWFSSRDALKWRSCKSYWLQSFPTKGQLPDVNNIWHQQAYAADVISVAGAVSYGVRGQSTSTFFFTNILKVYYTIFPSCTCRFIIKI
ncbi:uncharacterized protein LOC124311435 [Daphnia pulicaria]|uniref:uncharacterized protein LOC124311435 n=1 Tax=Daphnia pulicaria TaxID=35523 RepID=UPI001EEC7AC0|nr:uncharacterized protein LOC124311435 [Daphnia pulicaria]